MIKLSEGGAYIVDGSEIIEVNESVEAVKGKLGSRFLEKEEALKNTIQLIGAMEGSIVEKVEAIEEKQSLIKEYEEDIEMYEAQFMQFKTFYRMVNPYIKPEIKVWVGVEWNPNFEEEEE